MAVCIRLLGRALATSAGSECELERKSGACIALLAVEGRQSRTRLADLLWPNATSDDASRGNLRQLARRLRLATGADVLTSSDPTELHPAVEVDVQQVLVWAAAGDWSRVAERRGALLAGMEFDDCPELSNWLQLTRMQLTWTMAHALSLEASRLADEQGSSAALPLLLRWLELDPVSEEAYRRLMRLFFSGGDRGAALRAFENCRATLRSQLDLEPSEETVSLAREIKGSPAPLPLPRGDRRRLIPLAVLRPPLLVGRQEAWEKLASGFDAGKLLMVSGPAGVGKTRLVQDFVAQHRDYRTRYIGCRPGDRELPYIHFARAWRQDLAVCPGRLARLPAWAIAEVARILPELGESPPPLTGDEQRQRFFDANLTMAKANDDAVIVVSDDVHHLDAASHELGIYMGMHFVSEGSPLRSISTFRPDEVDAVALGLLESLFESGEAIHVELTPLSESDLAQMLQSLELDLPRFARDAGRLFAYTGGIPFYVVETLKALLEAGELGSLPEAVTASDRVHLTIERRLQRLSPQALRLLRAAAIVDEPLRVRMALDLVDGNSASLGRAWEELERGLLLRNGSIAHELLRSVVLATMPEPERVLLHERVATALEATGAHPGRVARHFEAAGQLGRAAQCFDAAAQLAHRMLRSSEARELRSRASKLRASTMDIQSQSKRTASVGGES